MISTLATLSPQMGGDPLLKAFVICVVAGLGNVWGAGVCAFGLALIEAAIGSGDEQCDRTLLVIAGVHITQGSDDHVLAAVTVHVNDCSMYRIVDLTLYDDGLALTGTQSCL